MGSGTGLQPPPDNSFDRRARRRRAAHRAQIDAGGFQGAPAKRLCRARAVRGPPISGLDPVLAKELGLEVDEDAALPGSRVGARNEKRKARSNSAAASPARPPATTRWRNCCARAARNSRAASPGRRIARSGRTSSKAASASRSRASWSRRATSRPRSRNWSKAPTATTARRCCWASPVPAKPTPWRR